MGQQHYSLLNWILGNHSTFEAELYLTYSLLGTFLLAFVVSILNRDLSETLKLTEDQWIEARSKASGTQ